MSPLRLSRRLLAASLLLTSTLLPGAEPPLQINSVAYPPLSYSDGNPTRRGLMLDLTELVWHQLGWPMVPRFYPFKRALELTKAEPNSCLVPTSRTPEREQSFKWIGPLYRGAYTLLAVPNRVPLLANLDEAQRYRIGVMRGSALQSELERRGISPIVEATPTALFKLLNQGSIDLWATHDIVGHHEARLNQKQLKVALRLHEIDSYIACNLAVGDETIRQLQQKAEEVLKSRAYQQVQARYGEMGSGKERPR
ncbi:substrate-binding periplasmic protein [Chitinimonas lacunae]|uniref:Substrate-binding periplasmic protein n=1 Tax=Chitinimonas lacunae TaxID=1963018 RepID=A0ABV8MIG3_9NEIS